MPVKTIAFDRVCFNENRPLLMIQRQIAQSLADDIFPIYHGQKSIECRLCSVGGDAAVLLPQGRGHSVCALGASALSSTNVRSGVTQQLLQNSPNCKEIQMGTYVKMSYRGGVLQYCKSKMFEHETLAACYDPWHYNMCRPVPSKRQVNFIVWLQGLFGGSVSGEQRQIFEHKQTNGIYADERTSWRAHRYSGRCSGSVSLCAGWRTQYQGLFMMTMNFYLCSNAPRQNILDPWPLPNFEITIMWRLNFPGYGCDKANYIELQSLSCKVILCSS